MFTLILLIAAAVCFALYTFRVAAPVDLLGLGALFVVISLLIH